MILRLLLSGFLLACTEDSKSIPQASDLKLELIDDSLQNPVDLVSPPDDARLFVLEQVGRVRVIEKDKLREKPFLDLVSKIASGGERGLLGMAFHPQYQKNGRFFVHYSDLRGDTQISEFVASSDPNLANAQSERSLLQVKQPFSNHNGGQIAFGPDGFLYISLGDGGAGGDPYNNGQNLGSLLGKILRIDVDGEQKPYGIPADNPFVKNKNARPEIWAYGIRNAWKFSFDRKTQEMYIADVGQNAWEEIDIGVKGGNFGWNKIEGDGHCFPKIQSRCDQSGFVAPIYEYPHPDGYSVTGGFVYRGKKIPKYQGVYFFADYQVGWTRSFRYSGGKITSLVDHTEAFGQHQVSSFGEDSQGEIYLVDHNGSVYRIVPR